MNLRNLLGERLDFWMWILKEEGVGLVCEVSRVACIVVIGVVVMVVGGGGDGGERKVERAGV